MAKKKATEADGVIHFGPQVSAKDTDAYVAVNTKGDPFARHEWAGGRMMNGHYNVRVFNRGKWRYYFKISHPSARRVNCLQRTHGEQTAFDQWRFPDRIIDKEKVIEELGFYQEADA